MWLTGRSDPAAEAELPLPLEIRPIRSARRMRLRIDEKRGILKLTCPVRTSRRAAIRWALEQHSWIESQLAIIPPSAPFEPGATIPFDGCEVRLVASEEAPRTGRLVDTELQIGGPLAGFARRVERFLRDRALESLSADVAEFAERAGVRPAAISLGDAATRWGSCSSGGQIRFNWRLICAPPEVRRYVAAHEVAHLKHLNHGREFRALERSLVGDRIAEVKAELRSLGPRLRRLGRGR